MNYHRRRRRSFIRTLYSFAVVWAVLSWFLPVYELGGFLLILAACIGIGFLVGRLSKGRTNFADEAKARAAAEAATVNSKKASERMGASPASQVKEPKKEKPKKSYGPEIDPIVEEGNRALSEMGRLYMSIKDDSVRSKINEIMRITDKIMQDAIEDPSDIPQIKKFFRYYLPTTIKLLNAYDRMGSQGIEGENIDKSMKNINDMLDVAIEAYKKRLDSLFENQALDIETDIDVMNQMLSREGLTNEKDFKVNSGAAAQAFAAEQKGY